MADKTDEQIAQEIQVAIHRLNTITQQAAVLGIKTTLDVFERHHIGIPAAPVLSGEVSRVFTPVKLPESPEENGNG